VQHKTATYLAAGTAAVIVADPRREIMTVHDARGSHAFRAGDLLVHESLPGFSLDVGALFARAKRHAGS
jgi:hypothetical protein